MATGDITNLAFTSQISGGNPTLNFSVGMSPFFSNATSIQLLYWPIWSVNGQTQYGSQHWITLTRPSGNVPFTSIVPLSLYAPSGSYEIRSITATDNTGANLYITQQQIIASGFSASTILANPNSDTQPPALQSLLVGAPTFAADGIHIHFDVKATDVGSGLDQNFISELLSPTGVSLQQWCKLDPQGIAAVDFSLNKFSASGDYKISTIRLEDLAGNNNMSQDWLQTNNIQPISINNPLSDITAPILNSFTLSAIFDPLTDRPTIVANFTLDDAASGLKSAFLRMNAPPGSSVFLDKWLYYDHASSGATHVNTSSGIALTTDFTPGMYTVNYLDVSDFASNKISMSSANLGSAGLMNSINVYFPLNPAQGGSGTVAGSSGSDYIFGSNLQNDQLIGNGGNDSLFGENGDDRLTGSSGNDTLDGGSGADTLISGGGNDVLDGGIGTDLAVLDGNYADYTFAAIHNGVSSGVVPTLYTLTGLQPGDIIQLTNTATGHTSKMAGIENINFANGSTVAVSLQALNITQTTPTTSIILTPITLTGDGLSNTLTGNAGSDTLSGLAGDDTLNGGAGNDKLLGGDGNDTLNGGDGNDALDGGNGLDTAVFNGNKSDYNIQLLPGNIIQITRTANAVTSTDKLTSIENVTFTDGVYVVAQPATSAGYDQWLLYNATTYNNDTLTGGNGADVFDGGAGNDTINGGAGNDTLSGGLGNDMLDGGTGDDTMAGGLGNDTCVVDSANDVIQESMGQGTDKVQTSLIAYTLAVNVENLEYLGTPVAILDAQGNPTGNFTTQQLAFTGAGNAGNNTITGGSGSDTLNGGAGADKLTGGNGNDTLDGGAGADTLIGGLGDDTYVVGSAANIALGIVGDTVTELLGAGTDTVQSGIGYALGLNLENLTLTGALNLNGTGNALANILTGNTGNNTLNGAAGNDTLDGGAGVDILLGGLGDDTLIYDSNDSKINGGAGIDTLKFGGATLDLSLITAGKITGIEKLDLTGNGVNSLMVNKTSLINLTGPVASPAGHDLWVTGDAGDSVTVETLTGAMWTDAGTAGNTTVGGVSYHQYTHASGAVMDHLYVQDTLTQIPV